MARQESLPGWYDKDVQSINPDAQGLLERYSGLRSEDVLPHVLSLVCIVIHNTRVKYANDSLSVMKPFRSFRIHVLGICDF